MILVCVALAHLVSPWWLLLTVIAGAKMLQASMTGFCPAAMVFKKIGFRRVGVLTAIFAIGMFIAHRADRMHAHIDDLESRLSIK